MILAELVISIIRKQRDNGIRVNPPVSESEIQAAETKLNIQLPPDFKEFYSICNGFDCTDYLFNLVRVKDLFHDREYGSGGIIFAELMIYSDVWAFRTLKDGNYEIFYADGDEETILTNSLSTFLEKILQGHVLENGGLYQWYDELKSK